MEEQGTVVDCDALQFHSQNAHPHRVRLKAILAMGQRLSLLNILGRSAGAVPANLTFDDIALGLGRRFQRVVILSGAGISVNAGIPDFRSPGTGLYSRIPFGENIFSLQYFRSNPRPFFAFLRFFIKKSFGRAHPTLTHYFIRLLYDKGLLVRNYTQNVDGLEEKAGVPSSHVIEAHGSLKTSHCIDCKESYEFSFLINELNIDPEHIPTCTKCGGIIKPDVVLFGEALFPASFFSSQVVDFQNCDLVIVIGTSLVVQPFASLYFRAEQTVPRLVINKTHTVPSRPQRNINISDKSAMSDPPSMLTSSSHAHNTISERKAIKRKELQDSRRNTLSSSLQSISYDEQNQQRSRWAEIKSWMAFIWRVLSTLKQAPGLFFPIRPLQNHRQQQERVYHRSRYPVQGP
ncbi:MAG: putative NAD-dependent deacetylase sir2A [Streblomastix strix]|uniref:Putative NAD-dependent deacetylase sir2A n=1 Tax=Streblomastix strix TaxID=222440 RepID=A0A5J4X2X5_9EUKA|nr:MAG: putative NAD-dependent deacetylase sir2A [Streblomastix strix]